VKLVATVAESVLLIPVFSYFAVFVTALLNGTVANKRHCVMPPNNQQPHFWLGSILAGCWY